jgi:hypothetical protein
LQKWIDFDRDWYRAAQTPILVENMPTASTFAPIDEEDEDEAAIVDDTDPGQSASKPSQQARAPSKAGNAEAAAAQRELRVHELLALLSCFIFPVIAAWLLHTIRSQLSRPSEGLVSNYNLMIFILVAEVRPISHAIKMTQRRTLFLQRRAHVDILRESNRLDAEHVADLSKRLNELEAHVAERAISQGKQKEQEKQDQPPTDALVTKASNAAVTEVRKVFQPELDALNRAMRRYEKRSTISSVQIETRLQDLETRVHDVVSLAAAAQRNADKMPNNYIVILTNWACAMVVVPIQYLSHLASLPAKAITSVLETPKRYLLGKQGKGLSPKENRSSTRKSTSTRTGDQRERKPKASVQA